MKPMKALTIAAALLAMAAGTAHAGNISIAPASGEQDIINDLGGNVPPAGLPLGLSGYTSESWLNKTTSQLVDAPNLMAGEAGNYTFTFLGKGNAEHHNTIKITVPGGQSVTFDNQAPFPPSPLTPTATLFATMAGEISFVYKDLTDGATISSSTLAANNTFDASYFLGIAGSTGCTNNTDPNVTGCTGGTPLTGPGGAAYIGFADDPWGPAAGLDHDFQDLGVLVTTPEPASMALIGVGLAGLGLVRRRRKASHS